MEQSNERREQIIDYQIQHINDLIIKYLIHNVSNKKIEILETRKAVLEASKAKLPM